MPETLNRYKIYWRPNYNDDLARFGDPVSRGFDMNSDRPTSIVAHRFETVTDNGTEVRFYTINNEGFEELTTLLLDVPYMITKTNEVSE